MILNFFSGVCSFLFNGILSAYWAISVSLSYLVPNIAISELHTLTSGLLDSLITLVDGIILPTVLTGAETSYSPSLFFFCLLAACILRAILTWTLLSQRGMPSDHINLVSLSSIFCCCSSARVFEAQMNFSTSTSEHSPLSAYSSTVKYVRPGIVSSSK